MLGDKTKMVEGSPSNCKIFCFVDILMYENFDLENIVTPVNADALQELLEQTDYNKEKTQFLVNGFKNGFSINYQGAKIVQKTAPNLKLRVGDKVQLWNKVMKEVKLKRFAGPFDKPPFANYIQSPIGLVEKDHGKDTRLIFHLSYPRDKTNSSVNRCTPEELCHVQYVDFDKAIQLCLSELNGSSNQKIYLSKSDYKSAFRNVGLDRKSWPWLILKAENPVTKKVVFFIDKCLPFGALHKLHFVSRSLG